MPNNIEAQVTAGIITIAKARSYISTNSIPVIDSLDQLTDKDAVFITVHGNPHERVAPNEDYYFVEVDVIAGTVLKADPDADQLKPLAYECQAVVNNLTAAALATQTGLTIDGIVPMQGAESELNDDVVLLFSARVKVALTFTYT